MQPLPEAGAESMSLNLGGTLFQVAWPGVKLNRRIQQKLMVTIDSIALHVPTYVKESTKPQFAAVIV
jgi:hypothetical protein